MIKPGLLLLLVSISHITIAQTITIAGSVKNEKGVPLGYAFVQDKQIKSAAYADSLGVFSLLASPNSVLLISSKGYKDAVVKIDDRTNLQVVLASTDAGQNSNNSQTANPNIDNMVYDAFSGHTMSSTNYNGAAFHVNDEKEDTHGSRFLFKDWLSGSVINAQGLLIENPAFLFKYDKIRGVLLLTHDQKSAIDVDRDQIRSFTLYNQQKGAYVFERLPDIDDIHFMQVLAAGSKYKIYKLTTTKFVAADYNINGLNISGNAYDEYVDEHAYYVLTVKGDEVRKLTLKKKSIKEIFGDEGNKLDTFFAEHNGDSIDDHFLQSLVDYMNK